MSALSVGIAWGAVLVLMALAFIRRKRIRLLPSLGLTFFITVFSLLSPVGKVLFTFHSLKITQDALFLGLYKSAILVGMVFLSQTIVSWNISFPGTPGKFIRSVTLYFERLTARRISFKKGSIISQIDEILLSAWGDSEGENSEENPAAQYVESRHTDA